jgi:hypothetical protein
MLSWIIAGSSVGRCKPLAIAVGLHVGWPLPEDLSDVAGVLRVDSVGEQTAVCGSR